MHQPTTSHRSPNGSPHPVGGSDRRFPQSAVPPSGGPSHLRVTRIKDTHPLGRLALGILYSQRVFGVLSSEAVLRHSRLSPRDVTQGAWMEAEAIARSFRPHYFRIPPVAPMSAIASAA